MARKTQTVVPTHLEVASNPNVYLDMGKPVTLYIRGRKDRVIARIEFGRKKLAVYGAREWKAQEWTYRRLQLEGISD